MLSVGAAAQQAPAPQPPAARPSAAIVNVDDYGDDDDAVQQRVLDSLVDEFLQIVDGAADRETAQRYIVSNEMNLEEALCDYIDNESS